MHWLIDGHNLIGQMPNLRLDDPNDEAKLLEHLRRYRARTGYKITVIFDSGQSYQPGQTKKQGGITIQFASFGKTADQLIKRRLRRVKNPQAVIVVTSDRAIQQAANRARVRAIASHEFVQQLFNNTPGNTNTNTDEGSQADIKLSSDEVDEWLSIFKQQSDDKRP